MMNKIKRLAAVLVAAAALGPAAPVLADPMTPSATLINQPVPRVCHYHRFKVGVMAQPGTSWANRRYVVNVYNPHWVRVLHKSGHAPTTHWLFWHVKAWKLGRYHTTYKTWNNGTLYKNKYITRSHRCS
jgi:hypothetical protein